MKFLFALLALGSVIFASDLDEAGKLASDSKAAEARPLLTRLTEKSPESADAWFELARGFQVGGRAPEPYA